MTIVTERKAGDNIGEMSFENLLGFFEDSGGAQEQALPFADFGATALARCHELVRRCLERALQRRAGALPSRVHRAGIDEPLGR
ncbi:MAG: hypothetical protein GY811_21850, partial [Myxococcales bacterium]|nr:hypothetical protein [Myxococcales bacterium]